MDRLARQPSDSSLKSGKQIFLSYLLDYIVIVILFGAISALNFVTPFNQHFALQNYTLQYPYAVHERVPVVLLYFCAVIAPALIVAVWTLAIDPLLETWRAKRAGRRKEPYRKGLWELNCGILGLLLANTAAYVITGVLKNAIGKPRPDLIDRCQPDIPQDQFVSPVFGLSNSSICTQTDLKILHDGFRSFPSGHSSSSFAGLFYLSLYLAGKLHFLDHQGSVWKVFVVMIPTLGAALIAGSRIMDARHHPFDVISGSLLGILCAFVAYRQYFPSVTSVDRMGRAYTVRRHLGASGPEPLRSVHRQNPSFSFEPADTSLDPSLIQDGDHPKPYSPGEFTDNPAGVHRTRSQALSTEPLRKPLRQRGISNPTDPRTSLGPDLGLNSSAFAGLSRNHSPDPSQGGNSPSLFGRPSADGPLGSENHSFSLAWQQQHPHPGLTDIEALRRSEFPGSPTNDGPSAPVEMNPLPSPKNTGEFHQQQQQQQQQQSPPQQLLSPPLQQQQPPPPPTGAVASHQRRPSQPRAPSQQRSHGRPLLDGADLVDVKAEEALLDEGSRFSFVEGGEHLIHPAFRRHS